MNHSSRRTRITRSALLIGLLSLAACGSPEERAQSYYERGRDYLAKNDPVKARVEFRNALQKKGDLIAAWRGLAQIEEAGRNWQAVAPIWRKISELDPNDVDTRLRLTKLMLLGGGLDEALKLANATVDIAPQNAAAIALRAGVLLKLNDVPGAAQEARRALEIDPNNTDAIVVLAAERFGRNDSQGALQLLGKVSAAQKDDIGIALFRIKIFEKEGKLENIEQELRSLVDKHPQERAFRTELLRFYVANKRSADAEKELRAVVAANPADIDSAMQLVGLLSGVKGPGAAREELVARIKAGGNVFPFQIALAEFDFSQGNFKDATESLDKLIRSEKPPENIVAARIKLAEMRIARRESSAAEPLIEEVLRTDARNVNALRLRAAVRIEQGRLTDAIADLRQALNDQPRSPELLTLLAAAYERDGSLDLADKQLNDATKAANYAANVGLNYVGYLQRRGNLSHAEDVLMEMTHRSPTNAAILQSLAQVRLQRQNWIGAQEIADQLRKLGDNRGLSEQIQAAALTGQRKYDDAIGVLEGAYSSNPGAIQPMFALVRTYVVAKQIDKAEAFLQSVLKTNPENSDAYVLMGFTQLAANAPDKAVASFNTAISKNPKNLGGYRALSDLLLAQKKNAEALNVLQAGLKEQPSNFALRMALAGTLESMDKYEDAITEYEAMLKDQPDSLVVANNLASLLSDHRSDKASIERAYTVASKLAKSPVPQFKDTLGWIYYLRGDFKAAVPMLEEAIAGLPNVALARYHLGMSYRASGDTAKAQEQLNKAAELTPDKTSALAEKIRAALKG